MIVKREDLWRVVLENPADDTPRLALADYLDDRPNPADRARAELIRVQVELSKGEPRECGGYYCEVYDTGNVAHRDCRYSRLLDRQSQLLRKWGAGWLPPSGRKAAAVWRGVEDGTTLAAGIVYPGYYTFRRGFVEEVRISTGGWPLPGRQPFDPAECGKFIRECLATNPVARVEFRVEYHEPTVRIDVGTDPAGRWKATAWAYPEHEGLDEDSLLANTAPFDRRELMAWLGGGFLVHVLGQVEFTPSPVDVPF